MSTYSLETSTGISCRQGAWLAASAIATIGKDFARYVTRRARMMVGRRRLSGMSDHMLKDIGIGRSEVDYRIEYGRIEDCVRMLGPFFRISEQRLNDFGIRCDRIDDVRG